MLHTATINELRSDLSNFLGKVSFNKDKIKIYNFGKPIAFLVPIEAEDKTEKLAKFSGFLGKGETGEELENRLRRSKKERGYIKKITA